MMESIQNDGKKELKKNHLIIMMAMMTPTVIQLTVTG